MEKIKSFKDFVKTEYPKRKLRRTPRIARLHNQINEVINQDDGGIIIPKEDFINYLLDIKEQDLLLVVNDGVINIQFVKIS